MNAYVDSSVLLRKILRQSKSLREWRSIDLGVASALVEVECLRTLDRLRLAGELDDRQVAVRRATVYRMLDAMEIVSLTSAVIQTASQPLPTQLRTLDALHLATALLWSKTRGEPITMATHDHRLGLAAQAHGLAVVGLTA